MVSHANISIHWPGIFSSISILILAASWFFSTTLTCEVGGVLSFHLFYSRFQGPSAFEARPSSFSRWNITLRLLPEDGSVEVRLLLQKHQSQSNDPMAPIQRPIIDSLHIFERLAAAGMSLVIKPKYVLRMEMPSTMGYCSRNRFQRYALESSSPNSAVQLQCVASMDMELLGTLSECG